MVVEACFLGATEIFHLAVAGDGNDEGFLAGHVFAVR